MSDTNSDHHCSERRASSSSPAPREGRAKDHDEKIGNRQLNSSGRSNTFKPFTTTANPFNIEMTSYPLYLENIIQPQTREA